MRRRGSTTDLCVPLMVYHYNHAVGGVDLADLYMVYYAIGRKSMKWYKRVVWRLIEMDIFNSFVVYRSHQPPDERTRELKFLIDLANALVTPLLDRRNDTILLVISSPTIPKRLIGKHFAYKSQSRGRCRVCGNKRSSGKKKGRKDTKTVNFCAKCNVHLCVGDCFMKYHTRIDYLH